jgi:hypothetical protein
MSLPKFLLNGSWSTTHGSVTGKDVEAVYHAIGRGDAPATGIPGARGGSDRRVDRALQLLRKAGFVKFAGGRWSVAVPREAQPRSARGDET